MRNLTKVLLSANNTGTQNSAALDCRQIYALSMITNFSDGAAAGTIKLQASNDVPLDGVAPPAFVPTNWIDIPNATDTIAAGAASEITVNPICYAWVRATWTSSGGAGTLTARINTQGV